MFGGVSASAETKYKVTFSNNSGTSTSSEYKKLYKTVEKGTEITLPSFTAPKGYINLGWTTTKGKASPLYKIGSRYTVYKNTKFYLVQKKLYTVSFADTDGKTDSSYESLKKKIQEGKTMILPESQPKAGYTFLGWSLNKNSEKADLKAGTKYKPLKTITLYAAYAQNLTVTYLSNDGKKVYKIVTIPKGSSLKLSGRANNIGYTFLGWATKPGTSVNPTYMVGKTIVVNSELRLYAVQYNKSKEFNYTESDLPRVDITKYTKVILVGDSRTYRMKQTLENQFSSATLRGVDFVAKGGAALSWFDETGYQKLIKSIGKGGTVAKPIAVVFNLGVNDMQRLTEYIEYMKRIEPVLKSKNCKLFYMSINPLNNVLLHKNGSKDRPETREYYFNQKIQSALCANKSFTYIDAFTYLMKKGYSFDSGRGVDTGYEDGIHYSTKTYKRIYAYVIDLLNKI